MDSRADEIREQCQSFHNAHPDVWDMFVFFTKKAIAKEHKRYSAQAIFESIRWEVSTNSEYPHDFKINNNFVALYARRFMKMYPEYDGIFRTRHQVSKDAPPTKQSPLRPIDYEYEKRGNPGATA
tara:strand:- start:301 stop:675 length:375 start_codon:yes stop_codon:yes gene_type:complete